MDLNEQYIHNISTQQSIKPTILMFKLTPYKSKKKSTFRLYSPVSK